MESSRIDALCDWMNGARLGRGPIEDLGAICGGTQNVMLRFRRGPDVFVLRAPPKHSGSRGEETLRREVQVGRWQDELARYRRFEGWPGPESLGRTEAIGSWLTRLMPPGGRPGIVHGDYHLANVLFSRLDAELAAIIDWELATIGDPLLDLGWVLATWPDQRYGEPAIVPVLLWEGFPDRQELATHYADRSERDWSGIDWYMVLACDKLGILPEGSDARACAGVVARKTGELLHARTCALFRRAERIVAAA